MAYASATRVSVARTKEEIQNLLSKFGAHSFAHMEKPGFAMMQFILETRSLRFLIDLPDKSEFAFTPTRGTQRHEDDIQKHYEQACRSMWRSLFLVIKAKLTAIEEGIASFENEFMAQLVLPNGKTVAEEILPQVLTSIESHEMPKLLGLD